MVMYAGQAVETGSTDKLFKNPQHPYTRALQKSIPALQPKGKDLFTIPGIPPDLSQLGPGCPFTPRCEFAVDYCSKETVRLMEVLPGQSSACLRVQKGELK
jgi:oligopeptide transport system ATP-binding protein